MSNLREGATIARASSVRVSRRGLLAGGAALAASTVFPRPNLALAQTQPPGPTASKFQHLFYGGNGTVPVDSGLPNVGVFYGVLRSSGYLLWYRYLGGYEGEFQWNTENPIGNGWGNARHVLGCGNGVIMMIDGMGGLYWYQYLGNGEADPSGATGWHPNSGNQIGNGWGNMLHVFVSPAEGRHEPQYPVIYAVTDDGALCWYLYQGEGEQDPSASTGWHPNSGNQIGNGWGNIQHLFGGNTGNHQSVFMVDENAMLKWYGYNGTGEYDPSSSTGWLDGSGYMMIWGF